MLRFEFCCLLSVLLPILPHLSLGGPLSIHVHSFQTIPSSAFPHSHLSGVPYAAAALHESCPIMLHAREGHDIRVVPPETGYPRASFRGSGGGVCPSVTNVCSQPFFVTLQVSVLWQRSDVPDKELPVLHCSDQLMRSTEPNLAFVDDPTSMHSTIVSPLVFSSERPNVQSLQFSLKLVTGGCGSLQLQLHFVVDGHLEHTTDTFIISVPTWGKDIFDFYLLQEPAPFPVPSFDFSRQPPQCKPVDWDTVEQLSDHRALVAAVELPSPFALAFVPMMAVLPFESR